MKIIWDATGETMYPVGPASEGLTSGSVVMIREIAKQLVKNHTVHVVANDVENEYADDYGIWWWPTSWHPRAADIVVMTHQLNFHTDYNYNKLILAHTGVVPHLEEGWANQIDAWPVFSETHRDLLLRHNPDIPRDRTFVTGLGVDIAPYMVSMPEKVKGRMLYGNDPQRGLWNVLDIFDIVRKEIPEATLHISYDFDRQLEQHRWEHSQMAELLLGCKQRIETTPGVVNLGALTRQEVIWEQLECDVHVMPSDPPNVGTQTHGIFQLECAAAGVPLVLSDVEAFPEVFGKVATILPRIGTFLPEDERRVTAQDYALAVIGLIGVERAWADASEAGRQLALANTWDTVAYQWEMMLNDITEKKNA